MLGNEQHSNEIHKMYGNYIIYNRQFDHSDNNFCVCHIGNLWYIFEFRRNRTGKIILWCTSSDYSY